MSKWSLRNDFLLASEREFPFCISCYTQVWRVGLVYGQENESKQKTNEHSNKAVYNMVIDFEKEHH